MLCRQRLRLHFVVKQAIVFGPICCVWELCRLSPVACPQVSKDIFQGKRYPLINTMQSMLANASKLIG